MFANTVKSDGFSVNFVFNKRTTSPWHKKIETNILSPKTPQCAAYFVYIEYILTHVGALSAFYDYKIAKARFYLYQDRQRAAEEMVNMLVNGGTKYNKKKRKKRNREKKRSKKQKLMANPKEKKEPSCQKQWKLAKLQMEREKVLLVVFGARMFGKDSMKLKGNRRGVTGIFWRALKRRSSWRYRHYN
ncbi:hypothetical protein BCV72DRAFT_330684 [Rhizopus microsporus var. microsporus]|uniref:Uncharacterized protein n=1 Tax=Rhizopus microsporus var. microsporus TaxID=86635 RepID=A0A1X0RGC2_RHIZD|nr:hypothetical protein BCV72DRAFT_330684 [Rhizopus microsporus var. microsporus]